MKKKNYKVRITKNKILKENEYDFVGDFASMGKSLIDSAKMAGQTFRRMFNATVFAVKTLNALRKLDANAMDNLRSNFLIADERLKQEQNRLIDSQPGVKDLKMFLAMTSPGTLFFDKLILDPNKKDLVDKFKELVGKTKKDESNKLANEAAYHNFIMRVAEITHNAKVDLTTKEDLEKNKLKKASSEVFKITKDDLFKKAIAYISSFYTKTDYKIEDKIYFEISDELYFTLKMIHDFNNENKNTILKHSKEKNLSNEFNRITKSLKSGQMRARFISALENFQYEGKLEKAEIASKKAQEAAQAREELKIKQEKEKEKSLQSDSYRIQIKNNNIILKEEDENNESNKSVDVDFKEDMQKSFSLFGLATLYLYVEKTKVLIGRNTVFTKFNSKFIDSLYKENKINTNAIKDLNSIKEKIISKSDSINNTIEVYNKYASEYNNEKGKESGITLKQVDLIDSNNFKKTINDLGNKSLNSAKEFEKSLSLDNTELLNNQIKKENKNFIKNLILEQEEESTINEEERRLQSSLSLILENIAEFKKLESIDFDKAYQNLVNDVKIISENIDENSINKSGSLLDEFGIPKNYFSRLNEEISSISEDIKLYKESENLIKDFIKQEKEIESNLEKSLEESFKKNQTSSEDIDSSKEKVDGKYTETIIKKKEDK